MDNSSNKVLNYKQIADPAREIVQYIDKRRKGQITSLKTRWKKFNDQCMGGIEPNSIYTVAGISGSGKSAFANSLETDLFDLNPTEDFVVLSFNFEIKPKQHYTLFYVQSVELTFLQNGTRNKQYSKTVFCRLYVRRW